ncbi:hypothetical protein [Aeromonas hydrophila]|uniref:Uncharacterized protein n=1 Tax=Aeromonas hydrophila TaxID=644 RepID=A0ABD7G0H3_AERHY|nr:hypothetical protein [Aeromonas hydrophila]RCF42160.1 hypothetical protein C6C11_23320 [Aeromonas hydrophila]
MSQELAISHYSRQWLGQIAANAKITPTSSGQRWLVHLTPDSQQASTVTLQVRGSGVQWQLLSLTNAEDWHTMSQPRDEICIDPERHCFWHCQAGPVPLNEQPRVLANFLADLQRICIHRGYAVASDPIPDKETEDD